MNKRFEARRVSPTRSQLGESPFWHPAEQVLYYCDIPGRRLHRLDPASGDERNWDFDTELGACAPIESGGLLIAKRDGLWRFDPSTGKSSQLEPSPCADPSIERFNDGKCDAAGRFWCGTVYEPRSAPNAALYCYERGRLQRREGGVTTGNGLAFSPDSRHMYWADTPAHTVHVFDFDLPTGATGPRREFRRFTERGPDQPIDSYAGRPDGATVDVQGNYWVAMYEGQRLLQLSVAGETLRDVPLPVRCPTMPCFGGADLKTLYITTASFRRPDAELASQPWAGCVLAIDVDVPGLPCNVYRD